MSPLNKKSREEIIETAEKTKSFQGAVFYIDILGIGALTKGEIKDEDLKSKDYAEWSIKKKEERTTQFLARQILRIFRKILLDKRREGGSKTGIQYAQLSDCAFIWSTKPEILNKLLKVATDIMLDTIRCGLLCRAGLSCGNIMQIIGKEAKTLGRFIIGEAVTNAVRNEQLGKGARIFCDENIRNSEYLSEKFKELIIELKNPFDHTINYEYQWYLHPLVLGQVQKNKERKLIELKNNIEKKEERFVWNRLDKGREQIDCTVKVLRDAIEKLTNS